MFPTAVELQKCLNVNLNLNLLSFVYNGICGIDFLLYKFPSSQRNESVMPCLETKLFTDAAEGSQ
jgi:hypothetical protein